MPASVLRNSRITFGGLVVAATTEVIMGVLDNESLYAKIDKAGMLQNIQELPDQVEDAWKQVQKFVVPTTYIKAKNVVILGMGGSAIGGDLVKELASHQSTIPVTVNRDYDLPKFVDHNSLVIAVSYSGNTEETLTAFSQAGQKGAKLLAISSGGQIAGLCRKYRAPLFTINYGAMPRAAIGHTFIPLVGIFDKLGLISLGDNEVEDSALFLRAYQKKIHPGVPTNQNLAKQISEHIFGRIPTVIGSGILAQVAMRAKTQLNENSKTMATFEILPELCHNTIVGFSHPEKLKDKVSVILLQSKFDHQRNRLRQQILVQIMHKKGIAHDIIFTNPKGGRLSEILHNILFGDYLSYYLAMLNNVDPSVIESIDFLKDKLSETKWEY